MQRARPVGRVGHTGKHPMLRIDQPPNACHQKELTEMNAPADTKAAKATTVVVDVAMDDGRVVQFAGKRKLLKESFINAAGEVKVRFDFRNGETRTVELPAGLMSRFAAHGAEQKFGDATAGLDDVDDCVLAIDELMERIGKGEWNVARESNGLAGTSVLAKALVEFTGKPVEKIKEFLATKTQAEKVALRTNPKVKVIVDRIEAEKAAKGSKIDSEALLQGLDG